MKISEISLGFIGFGHLAKTIAHQVEASRLISRSQLLFVQRDTHKMRENEKKYGISSTTLETMVKKSDVLLLAVRPQQTESVLQDLAAFGGVKKIISVVAGIRLAFYQRCLGKEVQILRTMPNLASGIGEGMTALCYSPECSLEFKSFSALFFQTLGAIIEVEESLMDVAVGVSGSGPGFVFRLIEAMARSGEKGGICYEKSLKMAAQTFLGAAKLILSGQSPQSLCEQIAVPGGTTEAGFHIMKQTELLEHFQETIDASIRHSQKISTTFQ